MLFVTTCHPSYSRPWIFPTLNRLTCRTVVLLDPDDTRALPSNVERIDWRSDRFYQHGSFLDPMRGLADDDVVMLADADAVIQRDFTDAERLMLDNLGDGFIAGPNMHPTQTGREELDILGLARPLKEVATALRLTEKVLLECRLFNWGLAAAKVKTWRRLRRLYAHHTENCKNPQVCFVNATWLQFAIACILYAAEIPVIQMSYTLHSHGHFSCQPEHSVHNHVLSYKDEVVFLAHYIRGVSHP